MARLALIAAEMLDDDEIVETGYGGTKIRRRFFPHLLLQSSSSWPKSSFLALIVAAMLEDADKIVKTGYGGTQIRRRFFPNLPF
jgi:nucleotide-binding universal stress UspA family protein